MHRYVDLNELRRTHWANARRVRDERSHSDVVESFVRVPRLVFQSFDIEDGFPIASTFVPRMQQEFFDGSSHSNASGEHTGTQRTEVSLTVRQAREGVRVPFSLSVRCSCPVCGGRGEIWSDPCAVCDGSGGRMLSHQYDLRVPPDVRDGSCLRYSVSPPYAGKICIGVFIAVR